jgi:hypothetical protein
MQLLSIMNASQSAADLLGAVEVVDAAFHRHQIVTMADWDESLLNLIGAHDRCGGVVRLGVRALFAASYENGDSVRSAVALLRQALAASQFRSSAIGDFVRAPTSLTSEPTAVQLELDLDFGH